MLDSSTNAITFMHVGGTIMKDVAAKQQNNSEHIMSLVSLQVIPHTLH